MLPIEEHTEASALGHGVDELLTGDLGVVVVRALLENGVGYVVSSWRDRPTPIDAAIDDARDRVLSPHGMVLRRLRSLAALEPIVTAPSGGITGSPPRGAVVFAGRRGLRPALERFVTMPASGAVVGFCFDDDALRIEDAIVIDPEPTAIGLVRAIDAAFSASRACARPALIVLRERSLGLRGTIRRRPAISPKDAAASDAGHRESHDPVDVATAATLAGLVAAQRGSCDPIGATRAVFVAGPMRQATERALAELAARVDAEDRDAVHSISIVASTAVGILPDGAAQQLLATAADVCVIGQHAVRIAERLRTSGVRGRVAGTALDPGSVRGEQLRATLASWLLDGVAEGDSSRDSLERLANPASASGTPAATMVRTEQRVPRRSEVLHRAVSPAVAAGLALAQGVIGVPGRIDASYPTYRTDTGVPLTVVPAALFAQHGTASAAPDSGIGVFLVNGTGAGIAEAAGSAGATIQYVDGTSPRAIGAAVGRACRSRRTAPHVLVVADLQRVAAPRSSTFGMDPDLVGTERLATSAVPPAATALVDLGDELLAGPTVLALDEPAAHAALDPLRELSPATWDLRRHTATMGRAARTSWNLRRRLVRAATGVDL